MIYFDWGLIDYEKALQRQLNCVEEIHLNPGHPGFLIFCAHPEVVTVGRQTQPEDVFAWKGSVVEVSRGGRATYHGPSQIVVYPIINIKQPRKGRGPQEVRGLIRALEKAIILTLQSYELEAYGKTVSQSEDKLKETLVDTGVWIGAQKIASIGLAVRRWVSFHGAAINLLSDSSAFVGLKPCGYSASIMTNVEACLNHSVDIGEFKKRLQQHCLDLL